MSITELYTHYETLDAAKEKAPEHEPEYRAIIECARNGPAPEKRLASQFIVKFQKFFPALKSELIDVLLSLCETPDVSVQRQAVKDIETFCRDSPDLCQRTSNTLTVLLQGSDSTVLTLVQKCLVTLLKMNPKGTLDGIFEQIVNGEDLVRERALTLIVARMKILIVDTAIPKEVEDCLLSHCRNVLEDVTGIEFILLMQVLTALPVMNTLVGRQQLLEIVAAQANLNEPFNAEEPESIDRLTQCIREAMPLFSKNVHSTQFVVYICTQVLPVLQDEITEDVTLDLFKLLAEMSPNTGEIEEIETCIEGIYNKLIAYMPLPKEETEEEELQLQFSCVECLMYTFHQLARKSPEFLTATQNAERLRDFRLRLQNFARGVQIYIKTLRQALVGKSTEAMKTEENKIKTLALKTTSNIHALIKDLFYNPPAYKAIITLSFKVAVVPAKSIAAEAPVVPVTGGQKRSAASAIMPIQFSSGDGNGEPAKKMSKDSRQMYVPPSGKFSGKAGDFPSGGGGGRSFKGRGFRKQW